MNQPINFPTAIVLDASTVVNSISDQTHRGTWEDAVKKRRKYLVEKARLRSNVVGSKVQKVVVLAGTVYLAVITCFALCWVFASLSGKAVLFTLVAAVLTRLFWTRYQQSNGYIEQAKSEEAALAYVPPVAEQLAAFPADEILLRGSDQPATGPSELLRAAQEGAQTGTEELLLPGQVHS